MKDESPTYSGTLDALREINACRSSMYRVLASFYWKELSQEQVEQLSAIDFSQLEDTNDLIAEGGRDLNKFLRRTYSGTRQTLAVDYARVFLAAGENEKRMAIPFESVFSSESGLLMQEPRDEVCKMMYAEHFEPDPTLHTPEDHLSFELEFMAMLCDQQTDAAQTNDVKEALRLHRVQSDFHKNHLLNWIDEFCDAIAQHCETTFYLAVSKITRGWIHQEYCTLEEIEDMVRDIEQSASDEPIEKGASC